MEDAVPLAPNLFAGTLRHNGYVYGANKIGGEGAMLGGVRRKLI